MALVGNHSIYRAPTISKVVQNLKQLITQNKEDLENGDVPLCLTPEVLVILNHGFEHLGDTRNGGDKSYNDLNFLQEAFSSTHYLRLSHGGNSTIQTPLDLTVFTHLSQLDIKRIPIHWIGDVKKFKDRLTLIRMCRSINYLEELLKKSAEPDTIGLPWTKLKKLYLANNFIKELDDSLNLLPRLEVLDLSQNYLTKTRHYLQCLTELVHLNISYNSLTCIPVFSPSCAIKLKTLVLRANHIEQIEGIETLKHLETLDLTSNILCDHGILIPLRSIPTLTQLYLDENPLSYNPRHRILTGSILTPQVIKQFSLDGQKFSDSEIQSAATLRAIIRPSPNDSSSTADIDVFNSPSVRRRVKMNEVNDIREIPQPDDELDGPALAKPPVDEDVGAAKPSPRNSERLSQAKTRIEMLREEFGDSWLQSANGYNTPPKPQVYIPSGSIGSADSKDPVPDAQTPDEAATTSGKDNAVDVDSKYDSLEETGDDHCIDSQYGSIRSSGQFSTDNDSTHSADNSGCAELDIDYDPFIIKMPGIDAEEFLLTFNKRQIIEKSIEGIITEMLDLSALLDVHHAQQDGREMVRCKFDYFRKDRRERCYVTEDLNDALRLIDILQPIAATSQSSRRATGISECLKCGKQFMVKKSVKGGAKVDCLHCGSDMVIELSSNRNTQSTPYGTPTSSSSDSPPKSSDKVKLASQDSDSQSNNSIYLSTEEGDYSPMPTTAQTDRNRLRSDTADTDTTIDGTCDWLSTRDSSHTESEDEGVIERPAAKISTANTPDSVSYQSIESTSDISPYTEDHVDDHCKLDSLSGLKFDPTNLSYIDHRLKLHLTVSYFQDHEQPACTVRCKCVEYTKPEEYPALVLLTNTHLYIFRLRSTIAKCVDVGGQLVLVERCLLSDVCYIEIGLSHQNIRVELDKSGYCLLIRDMSVGQLFLKSLSRLMNSSTFNEQSKLKTIGKINQEYYNQISRCLPDFSQPADDNMAVHYVSAFRRFPVADSYNIDLLEGCQPVSLIVQGSSLYVVKETYYLPFTRKRLARGQVYFMVESTIPIQDIASLSINRERCEADVIEGFEEQASELIHRFMFVSAASLSYFIDSIQSPWKDVYNVDLEINCKP